MKPHLQLRKSIVLLLIGCMFLSSSAFADAEGDYTYTVTDGKTTTTAYTGSGEDISIPPTLGGYPTVAAGADPTIGLWDPEYSECGWVTINGGVSGTLGPPFWDWGDGTTTTSYFAAYHRYLSNGTYTVLVTAEFCSSASASKIVNITNAEDPGCPSESDSSCRYLFPYNLHLVAGQTTATPLQFRDQSGNLVTGVTAFDPGDATLVSISEDGYVTALRTETSTEIGAWMHAKLDGKWAANSCVVRVLPTDYALAFSEIVGEHTVLYYPSSIEGEDLDALVDLYQMPTVNDYAYEIQSDLMGVQPSGGCRQIIEVDLGVSETNRVCGMAGNPIRIGWNIEGGQNCFLLFPRSPQWGVIFHEMGHSFLGESPGFARALDTFYSEGMATAVSIADLACILGDERSYPIEDLTRTSLLNIYSFDRTLYLARRQEWLDGGANFSNLNQDIVDGIWLYHAEPNVPYFASRFFLPLQPKNFEAIASVLCDVHTINDEHTFYAALVSAAAGEDLSALFTNTYHFPIDQSLFVKAYSTFSAIITVPTTTTTSVQPTTSTTSVELTTTTVIIDSDGDGVPDNVDNCPNKPNGSLLGTCVTGSDKEGASCHSDADCVNGCSTNGTCSLVQEDKDSDGVGDVCDNCPATCNPQQQDADKDGLGDLCDPYPGCGGCSVIQCEEQCS